MLTRKNLSEMTLMSPDGAQGGGADGGAGAVEQGQQHQPNTAETIFGGRDEPANGQSGNVDGAGEGAAQQGQGGGKAVAGAAPPASNVIPLEAVEKIVQSMQAANKGTPQPEKQISQEEFDKMFNVYKPTPELVAQLRDENPEVAVQAIGSMVQGMVKHAATLAAFHTMQEMQKLQTQMSPAMEFVQSQQMDRLKNEFFEAYPNLKGLEPLLLQIRDSLIKEGTEFKSKEDAFKAVAERANGILTKVPGYTGGSNNNNGGNQPNQNAGNQQTGRRMPTLAGKGQGGNAGGKGSAATKSTAERIFGPR